MVNRQPLDVEDLETMLGKKPLHWFDVPSRPIFAFAGIWRPTERGNAYGFLTTEPNAIVAPIHPKAMITILVPEDVETWLRGSYDEVVALQKPYDAAKMTVRGPVFPTRTGEK